MQDHVPQIKEWTSWLRAEMDLTCSRICLMLRRKGINPKTLICAKIFPDTKDPVSGILITQDKVIYQFGYNLRGVTATLADFEEWLNISETYQDHRWRDEILAALALIDSKAFVG